MPLPPPDCTGTNSRQRPIAVGACQRSDGLWDAEGRLAAAWPEPVPMAGDKPPAGLPMRPMWMRPTVVTTATIVAVHAATDAGSYGAGSGTIALYFGQGIGARVAHSHGDPISTSRGETR